MSKMIELLSSPTNFAIVQLPGRNYPGVVVQGDTLMNLVNQLAEMSALLTTNRLEDLSEEIDDMRAQLGEALARYESVCAAHEVDLPFPKPSTKPT